MTHPQFFVHLFVHHFAALIAALILASQLIAVVIIRRAAPNGPLTPRKERWLKASAEVLVLGFCAAPFYNNGFGVAILIFSLLTTASIIRTTWILRVSDRGERLARFDAAVRRSTRGALCWSVFGSAACVTVLCVVLFLLSPRPTSWAYWTAVGIAYYEMIRTASQATAFYCAYKRNGRDVQLVAS
jgi:hypothetical protein